MKYNSEKSVKSLFELLLKNNINYILLRNINNELPHKLEYNKDIDIVIHEKDEGKMNKLLVNNKWTRKRHPLGHLPFLYGIRPFHFYVKEGISLDICFELTCRSLNKGEWFPLDMMIQESIWLTKRTLDDKVWRYQLSLENEFIHLITRCIFDKKTFNEGYIIRIENLLHRVDKGIILHKFELVFFKFSQPLLKLIEEKQYSKIIQSYLQFKDY